MSASSLHGGSYPRCCSHPPSTKRSEHIKKWLPHRCLLGGPKEGGNAMSPLHSRGSPTPSAGNKVRSGPQQRITKSEVATSTLPSWGPKRGRKYYVTPTFSGIPNAKCGEQNKKWLPHPRLLGGPKEGGNGYVTPALSGIPNAKRGEQNKKWSPTKGNKIKTGYLTPAFSGAQKRAEMLCYPCIHGDPQRQARGTKSEVVPNKGEQNQKWLPQPCLLGGPKEGGNAMSPLHSWGSPMPSAGNKIRSGPQQRLSVCTACMAFPKGNKIRFKWANTHNKCVHDPM